MNTGTPSRKECESEGSWTPATPFRPILPRTLPIYVNGQANQPDQANWQGSECFSSVCTQTYQSNGAFFRFNVDNCADMNRYANNGEVCSAGKMSLNYDNVEAGRVFAVDPAAEYRNVSFASLLALANAAAPTDEISIPHQHSYDLNFHPGTMPNGASHKIIPEFVPTTPDKAMKVESKLVNEIENSWTDDRKNQERHQLNNDMAVEMVDFDSSRIQCNKQLLEPVTDASVTAVYSQMGENHNPDREGSHSVDLNKTPQQKPRRKKHRPKVAREDKPRTPKSAGLKENRTGKRKYVRKKGLNKDSTSSAVEAAGESINLKTPETSMESCKKTLNFGIGLIRDENSKENPRGKRKYVRKNGINKERSNPTEAAAAAIDLKTPEPTKESCTKTLNFDIKQTGDENSTCHSTFDLVSESQAKDFCTSKVMVQLGKGIEVVTSKPLTPQPNHSTENQTGKRKYIRKKGLDKDSSSTPREAAGETNDLRTLEPSKKSCRRTLNFDLEGQLGDENSMSKSSFDIDSESQGKDIYRRGTQSRSIVQLGERIEVIVENTESGIAYDLTHSVNQLIKDYISLAEGEAPRTPVPPKTHPQRQKQYADSRKEDNSEGKGLGTADNWEGQPKQILLQNDSQLPPRSANDPKCRTLTISTEQAQACVSKRENSDAIKKVDTSSLNLIDIHYHTLQTYQIPGPHFPNIYKKKRTEKVQNSATSSTSSSVSAATNITLETKFSHGNARADSSASVLQDKQKTLDGIVALSSTERLKKKRTRGPTWLRDLASLTRIAECVMQQTYPGSQGTLNRDKQFENSQRPQTCTEALAAETLETLARKKRTKKINTLVNSMPSSTNGAQKQQNIILSDQHFSSNSLDTPSELTWKQMFFIDTVIERLKNLDINKESSHSHQEQNALVPYYMVDQEQNAIVLYGRDGRLIPFQGSFDIVRKRRPRAKVELDEETNRVWKLLMQNINSEGIDGTDEENAKWWEEERRVFHGRVDSFIARMHLVQGDRRFSQWKGSVVDSVVGVFLTQNVSDHLSSSAFMSVAANFPLKSKSQKPDCEEGPSSGIEEPVVYVLDPEDTIEWNEKVSHRPACNHSSMTIHGAEHSEEKEAFSSNDSLESSTGVSLINESKRKLMNSGQSGRETYIDALSSQNSMDSSIAQNADRTRSSSNSDSETGDLTKGSKLSSFNGSNSFVELLQMVGSTMLHEVCNHGNSNVPSDKNSKDEHICFQTMEYDKQREKIKDLDGPKVLRVSGISPSSFHQCLTPDLAVEVECYDMSREETRSFGISENNDKSSVTDQIASTPEFTSQTTDATKLTVCGPEATRCKNTQSITSMQEDRNVTAHQSQILGDSKFAMANTQQIAMQQYLNSPKLYRETIDAIESSNAFDKRENTRQKTLVDWNKHDISFSKELNEINDATSKPKGRRIGKEKQNDFDWDSLRRQVEVNGSKKERPENTMDSVDWEAVRCADVNKIADTIKARGMNNMLAQRIKDFLNRLVRDHGSINLEWLRDVPPDQAKEYLLSIRGLGLKSVECVRLLTLHHLAFPVDTNVGRIAVRLGWVPLQPLPESLQLHLLELYPVLESIQKYLWPRLCKLDQKTLYELHYQMITFGKVFCTKSKPNCNACPMRGECRHFASAFASSRLALPGLEEKAIVTSKENRTTDRNLAMMINQLPLPPPRTTELSMEHQHMEAKTIVNNCEPIIEEPTTPEPECIQESENDIEDIFCEDPNEIPTIKLNMKEFTQTIQNYMQENLELQEGDMSKALVALTAEAASIPTPKLKNVSRLRTEHQVYELPDSHPLLEGKDKREPDDPGRYLLAIWTPGETANSIQPPERRCTSQEYGKLCDEKTCFSCNNVRESESQIVRGTLLIPCRTAMRGSFPLNGTYFQVNEVFADHNSSLKPINIPREWIWNLPRRTVYFGTSVPTIFKGLTTEGIQHCFWRGYVCVRGFDQKTKAPRPLLARLHFPASKLNKTTGKAGTVDT